MNQSLTGFDLAFVIIRVVFRDITENQCVKKLTFNRKNPLVEPDSYVEMQHKNTLQMWRDVDREHN